MIAELVTIKLPPGMTRDEVLAAAHGTTAAWAANPDLLRKHFLLDDEGHTLGFYLWRSREAAEAAHGEAFQARVRQRFGCEPSFRYFDVLLNLDNLDGRIVEDLAELAPVRGASRA